MRWTGLEMHMRLETQVCFLFLSLLTYLQLLLLPPLQRRREWTGLEK